MKSFSMESLAKGILKRRNGPVARIVFTQKPVKGSWGGSNQFVIQMGELLRHRGFEVGYDLDRGADLIVVVDPRKAANKLIAYEEIEAYKGVNPDVRVLHRVNECDQRKGTDFIDDLLAQINELADFTVFISQWLRDHHAGNWFDLSRPNSVIYNGADPAIFHPPRHRREDDGILRLVTHHWAGSYSKGFDVYEELDGLIAGGQVRNVELRVIGRWPEEIRWRAARTFPPTQGRPLADKLRECDAYITASRWEPCGMHQVEGIQCGLPLIYHRDGGGIVEVGRQCGVEMNGDLAGAIEEIRGHYDAYRKKAMGLDLAGDKMCIEYAAIMRRLLFAGA